MTQPVFDAEVIYQALFDLTASLTVPITGDPFPSRVRRVMAFSDLPEQPAICQAEHDETVTEVTKMLPKTTLGAAWLIYHRAGADTSPDVTPATTSNAILQQIRALFPQGDNDLPQTLGGLVQKAVISGRIIKEHGDLDGQALLIVPLRITVPI